MLSEGRRVTTPVRRPLFDSPMQAITRKHKNQGRFLRSLASPICHQSISAKITRRPRDRRKSLPVKVAEAGLEPARAPFTGKWPPTGF